MYRICALCGNPSCRNIFPVEFQETGPLYGTNPVIAFELVSLLRNKRPVTYTPSEDIAHSLGLDKPEPVEIPEHVECPKCHMVFIRADVDYLVENAKAAAPAH